MTLGKSAKKLCFFEMPENFFGSFLSKKSSFFPGGFFLARKKGPANSNPALLAMRVKIAPGALLIFIFHSGNDYLVSGMRGFLALIILLLPVPAFAANLSITGLSVAPAFANTRDSVDMLNLSLNVSAGSNVVNITSINVTIVTAAVANVSAVQIRNATGSVIGASTSNSTATAFTVSLSPDLSISGATNSSITININLSTAASKQALIAVNVTNASIATRGGDNITFFAGANSNQSNNAQIQDVHANASVSPNFADTNVTNQTFTYTLVVGSDKVNRTTIFMPPGYSISSVLNISVDGTECLPGNVCPTAVNTSQINVNFTQNSNAGVTGTVKINFTANTSAAVINSTFVNSTISGSNMTSVATDTAGGVANVTTRRMLNVTNVELTKATAVLNGTDYWEFNFSLQTNANVSGMLQFKIGNFTEASGTGANNIITPTEGNFTLRKGAVFNSSQSPTIDVRNDYNYSTGIVMSVSEASSSFLIKLTLRVIVPKEKVASSTWQSVYSIVYRTIP